jgi:hypothetical protein
MPALYPTYAQLKAAQIITGHLPGPVNWDDWDAFKLLIASAPLDVDEESEGESRRHVLETA